MTSLPNTDSRPGQPLHVGDGILAAPGGWSFGGDLWRVFDQHIRRSIPLYDELHELVTALAGSFVSPGATIYDFGCSTGTLCVRLAEGFPEAQVIGVDVEPNMIRGARRARRGTISYSCEDLRRLELTPCDLITCCYTLQFLPVSDRAAVLSRAAAALRPGGAMLISEKVKRRDPKWQAECRRLHDSYKLAHGFSRQEMAAKSRSIEDVLTPLFDDENVTQLESAGFQPIRLIFRYASFDAWLAIKP